MAEPSSPLIAAFARQVRAEQPDCTQRELHWAVMKKLGSKDHRVSIKVKSILQPKWNEEGENAFDLANRNTVANVGGIQPNKSASLARRPLDNADVSELPVLVSSFEEEITVSSQGLSSFFDGELSTAEGLSPITVKKSPSVEYSNGLHLERLSQIELDEAGERKCTICPIC